MCCSHCDDPCVPSLSCAPRLSSCSPLPLFSDALQVASKERLVEDVHATIIANLSKVCVCVCVCVRVCACVRASVCCPGARMHPLL